MDYDKSRETVLRLISRFGNAGEATFYRRSVVLDPLTGNETATEASHTIKVVVLPDRDAILSQARTIDHDVRFMVPASGLSIVPTPGDQVELPGRSGRFAVVAPVERMAPDGVDICFTCMARKIG